jgi:hypothetical protein
MEIADALEKIFNTLVESYEEKYGSFSDRNDPYYFMVSDYYATGEGRTISILITTGEAEYSPIKEFYELFGSHLLLSVEFVPRNFFFETYGNFIPPIIPKIIDLGYFSYQSQMHLNLA